MITFKNKVFDELEKFNSKVLTFKQIEETVLRLRGNISPVLGHDCSHLYGGSWKRPTKHDSRYLISVCRGWYRLITERDTHYNTCRHCGRILTCEGCEA